MISSRFYNDGKNTIYLNEKQRNRDLFEEKIIYI